MDGIVDQIMLKKLQPLDEDTMRRELRVRSYHLDRTKNKYATICKNCGYPVQKGETWKKITATKPKMRAVFFGFYYCSACGMVGEVHQ